MKLRRIRLREFRKFAAPIEIDGLADGLNVLHGPNEAGKSTIAQALRTLFLDRHNTGGAEFAARIAPEGMDRPAPEVEVELELGGEAARIRKTFLQRPRAELTVGSQRWEGSDADEELARRLGFGFPGRGASRADTHGIPGLLWIEQGASNAIDAPIEYARETLQQRLRSVLGEVAGAGNDRIAQAIAGELAALRTTTGKDRGPLLEAERTLEATRSRRDALQQDADRFRQLSDSLARDLAQHEQFERERPWEAHEARKRAAEARQAELEPRQRALAASRASLQDIQARIDGLHQQAATRERDQKALAGARAKLAEAGQAHADAQQALTGARQRSQQAHALLEQARQQRSRAEQRQRREALTREQARSAAEIEQIESLLAEAATLADELARQRARAAALALPAAELKKLQQLAQQRRETALQREAVATRLSYRLQPGQAIDAGTLGTLSGSGKALLTAPATLRIAGVGEIDIEPGGADVARLAEQASRLDDQFDALCTRLGVPDLAAAEQRHAEGQALAQDMKVLEARRSARLGAQDEAGWRARLAEAQGRRAAAARELTALPATDDAPPLDEASRQLADAEAEAQQAGAMLERQAEAARQAELACEVLRGQIAQLAPRLEGADADAASAAHQRELVEALARRDAIVHDIAQAEQAIAALDPDLIADDITRQARALAQLARQREELAARIASQRGQLRSLGAEGIDEQLAAARQRCEQAERHAAALRLRADALQLLQARLQAHQHALVERLYAPLQGRLAHYLRLLLPGHEVAVEIEALQPRQLRRDGAPLAFEQYSHGTREQLGVIVRLAYADLLREAGEPTLVILDDALVHSDAERREQMKRILHDAARRHQILLLTCHPEDWRDAGAERMVDVAALASAPGA
ncbi:MAG TPA: AAA family ATPase [Ottowia sp.]|uniref:AAA family ATPase n=1 Tax=Ottowia sp. TaxID=1898956 RepID=UPI002CD8E516|nr:AAA family ATPase [Ottowia sp.]HMN20391.1 AAA family ATPase [Ottowia sp.]